MKYDPLVEKKGLRLTFTQKGIFYHQLLNPENNSYNISTQLSFDKGGFSCLKFETVVNELIREKEILRSTFSLDGEIPIRVINHFEPLKLVGLKKIESTAYEKEIKKIAFEPFSLDRGPLFRIKLFETETLVICFLVNHHIILDGFSLINFKNEILRRYNGFPSEMKYDSFEFSSYVNSLFDKNESRLSANNDFWIQRLKPYREIESINHIYSSPGNGYKGSKLSMVERQSMSKNQSERISKLLKKYGTTAYTFFLSIYAYNISRINGGSKSLIGLPVLDRRIANRKDSMGLFINTSYVGLDIDEKANWETFLSKTKSRVKEALFKNQYDIKTVLEGLNIKVSGNEFPLSNYFFNGLIFNDSIDIKDDFILFDGQNINFDLNCYLIQDDKEFHFVFVFNKNKYDPIFIETFIQKFFNTVDCIVEYPKIDLLNIKYFGIPEQKEVDKNGASPSNRGSFVEATKLNAVANPDKAFLNDQGTITTFGYFDQITDTMSYWISRNLCEGHNRIAILLKDKGLVFQAMVSILKLGHDFVFIDPNDPQERINSKLEIIEAQLIISDSDESNILGTPNVLISELRTLPDCLDKEVLNQNNTVTSNGGYIHFTSGSTGTPKAVYQKYDNLYRLISNYVQLIDANESDNIGGLTSPSFDSFFKEFFGALLSRSTIFIGNYNNLDPNEIGRFLTSNKISVIQMTPSLLRVVAAKWIEERLVLPDVRIFKMTGEAVRSSDFELFRSITSSKAKLAVSYGLTEISLISISFYDHSFQPSSDVFPIGKPIPNTQVIVGNKNDLKDYGYLEIGEIIINSDCLFSSYLNKREEASVTSIGGSSFFSTGDLGFRLPSGEVFIQGRKDFQIKLNGIRIEPEEVEHSARRMTEVKDAIVTLITKQDTLVMFYSTDSSESDLDTRLRSHLSSCLPEKMIPAVFIRLEKLVLNTNGKIDRNYLIQYANDCEDILLMSTHLDSTLSGKQKEISNIWRQVLDVNQIFINSNFFHLGGDSLKAMKLQTSVSHSLGLEMKIKDIFDYPTLSKFSDHLLSIENENIFTETLNRTSGSEFDLSRSQYRLWILSQFNEAKIAYNIYNSFIIKGKIYPNILDKSLKLLINKYEILRTVFRNRDNSLKQIILPYWNFDDCLEVIDLSSENIGEDQIYERLRQDARFEFDLENGPLFIARMYIVTNEVCYISFNIHHIISDALSLNIFINQWLEYYQRLQVDSDFSPAPLNIQFSDFSNWHNQLLKSDSLNGQREFWLDHLSGELPTITLSYIKERPSKKTYNGSSLNFDLPSSEVMEFTKILEKQECTLFMGLFTIVNTLLKLYTLENEIIIGTSVSGRGNIDLSDQMGVFVNTLPIRTIFDVNDTFESVLQKVKKTASLALDNQTYPFDLLVDDLNLDSDPSRNPLFDVMMNVHYKSISNRYALKSNIQELAISPYQVETNQAILDMVFDFYQSDNGVSGRITYNTDIFNCEFIEQMHGHLIDLIRQFNLSFETKKVKDVELLSENELKKVLGSFNTTKRNYNSNLNVLDLLDRQVQFVSNEIAVSCLEKNWTYKEFGEIIDFFSRYLIDEFSIEPGDIIGIRLKRTEWLPIALFSTLKAGAAFVPIHPEFPEERYNFMVRDCNCKGVINDQLITQFRSIKKRLKYAFRNKLEIGSSSLAYVNYTSGSTGEPKGCLITHNNLMSFVLNAPEGFRFNFVKKIASTTQYTFDISVLEIIAGISLGKQVHVYPEDVLKDPYILLEKIEEDEVEFLQCTPSRLQQIYETGYMLPKTLKVLLVGGEDLSVFLKEYIQSHKWLFGLNVYGPTETTVWSTSWPIIGNETPLIGKPLLNEKIYVLNESMFPQPIGAKGEIYIGGHGVGLGYLNNDNLTKKKFIKSPFLEGDVLYRTGDFGLWLNTGELKFIGRVDDQIKIRGHRVELGEIQRVLEGIAQLRKAVVLFDKNAIKAFYTSDEELLAKDIKNILRTHLPSYMIPSYFMRVDKFELNPAGKINRKVLRGIEIKEPTRHIVEPKNVNQKKLLDIWIEILDHKNIGTMDDFFNLGGDSIKAMQIVSRVEIQFDVRITLEDIYKYRNITELSEILENYLWFADSESSVAYSEIQ